MKLPCLSVIFPYPILILTGAKPVEWRTKNLKSLVGQQIGIHCSKRDAAECPEAITGAHFPDEKTWHEPYGKIVGLATVTGIRPLPGDGLYGLELSTPIPLDTPIKARGQCGLFYVEVGDDQLTPAHGWTWQSLVEPCKSMVSKEDCYSWQQLVDSL